MSCLNSSILLILMIGIQSFKNTGHRNENITQTEFDYIEIHICTYVPLKDNFLISNQRRHCTKNTIKIPLAVTMKI